MSAKEEKIIVTWQDTHSTAFSTQQRHLLILITLVCFLLCLGLAIFLHRFDFYLAAAVFVAMGFFVYSQKTQSSSTITLTSTELRIGRHHFHLSELVGFWITKVEGQVLVNIESRRAILPITLTYHSENADEVRDYFLEVLPELEPRDTSLNDHIANWLHF